MPSVATFQMQVRWEGVDGVVENMRRYGDLVIEAIHKVAEYFAAVFEAFAKENAQWTDQTSNARQSLHTFIQELSRNTVQLFLAHGVTYGIWLEVRWDGRYAIIWPTIQAHLQEIAQMLQGIFG